MRQRGIEFDGKPRPVILHDVIFGVGIGPRRIGLGAPLGRGIERVESAVQSLKGALQAVGQVHVSPGAEAPASRYRNPGGESQRGQRDVGIAGRDGTGPLAFLAAAH